MDDLVSRLGRWSAGRGPLYLLLASRVRQMISEGELTPGTLLPPDRALATALAVGRTTVVAAYDQLRQEGMVVRRQGSGTRIAAAALMPDHPDGSPAVTPPTTNAMFLHLLEPPDGVIQLVCAAPAAMPSEVTEAYGKALGPAMADNMGYHPAGDPALREALAGRYTRRGVPTGPEQILVTTGAQQALMLLARLLVRPGDRVLVEAPTYPGAIEAFREMAATLRSVPVGGDAEPMIKALSEHNPAMAYVIPTYQNPTGALLPALARRRLAEEAARRDIPLIDDEVLADLGFSGPDPPPLASYAPGVLTIGSVSKLVWGGLRVGWLRAPASLITRLSRLKAAHDLGSNVPAQRAVAHLIPGLEAIREKRSLQLRQRHDHLCAELARWLPQWRFERVPGGQTLWVRLPHGDGASFAQVALRYRVAVLPGGYLNVSGGSDAYLRIPFLAPPEQLSDAVRRLAAAWSAYDGSAGPPSGLSAIVV